MTSLPPPQKRRKTRGSGQVIDLRSRANYKPDLGALARRQIAQARERLGLEPDEFAEILASVLGWAPSPEMVESWESSIVPPGDVLLAAGLTSQPAIRRPGDPSDADLTTQLLGGRFADIDSVYLSRSEFTSQLPPHALFDGATDVRISGVSLNVLCQQYPDDRLRALIEAGGTVRCLFLDPKGQGIRDREVEEGYDIGHLSSLNEINIQIMLNRVRRRLPAADQERLIIATYDETVRFNITLVDGHLGVIQPYLHDARGVESPTFVLRRQPSVPGLYPAFEQTFEWLWERRTEL